LKLIRPLNILITFAVITIGAIISAEGKFLSLKIILASLSGALTAAGGNLINDYYDIESDKINHPERPLPSGEISKQAVVIFYIIIIAGSITIALFVNLTAVIIVSVSNSILFFYSKTFKKIPLTGNLLIALLTGTAFLYGGTTVNNISFVIIPALFAFLINLIRELIKDMEDKEGDIKSNVVTLPIRLGNNFVKRFILILSIILILLTAYPFIFQYYRIEYFLIIMLTVNPLLVYIIKNLFINDSVANLKNLSNILKLSMVLGLIAIYFSK
jgi:geranylgeranylglycerol-phosphate geranylgeranyltransferase